MFNYNTGLESVALLTMDFYFGQKHDFGLGLSSMSDHYQRMQLVKYELLKNTVDLTEVKLFKYIEQQNSKL